MHHPLPEPLTVLAVSADDARHAPVRALLKAFPTPVSAHHAATAEDAIHALQALQPHVILVDRRLDPPGTDGLMLAEELVQRAPRMPVIVLCHESDRAADQQAADAGIADFLLVPGLSADRLEHAIRFALSHQRTLQGVAASGERHALALKGSNDGIWDWDVANDRVFYSPRFKEMLGYGEPELGEARGEWLGRVHPDERAALTQALDAQLTTSAGEHFEFEHRVQHRDGDYRWMLARATAVRDGDGRATRMVGSLTDVTDRREAEHRLQHDALHDALTGLPNRVLFLDRLDQAIRRARRSGVGGILISAPRSCSSTSTASR